jgi:glycerate kinase
LHFDDVLEWADLVIRGEGSLDEQTIEGNGPFGIAERVKKKTYRLLALLDK